MAEGKLLISTNNCTATEHPLASMAAYDVMKSGGNAFDAAVAAGFALSVLMPQLSGLGGDFFALFREARSGKVHCINGSGWAPSGLTTKRLRSMGFNGVPAAGPASVTVPGFLSGIYLMHQKFGSLEFPALMRRAVELAEDGFPVSPSLARAIARGGGSFSPGAKEVFMPGGTGVGTGSILKQPALAETLREIQMEGPDAFYSGTGAGSIGAALKAGGIDSDPADFSSFRAEEADPLHVTYRDHDVYEIPPNSMGATTLLILKQLESVDPKLVSRLSEDRVKYVVDAWKVAYAARDEGIGDPRFAGFDLKKFLESRATGGTQATLTGGDTTYYSLADEQGNLLSLIQSVFRPFGSKVFVDRCGFFLNNRASGFSFDGPNKLEPRKRPLHTLSALLLSKGERWAAMGTSGGEYRPQIHSMFVSDIVDYSASLEDAINSPRFLWDGGDTLTVEKGGYGGERTGLKVRRLDYLASTSVAQGVEVSGRSKKGVCDLRGDGLPVGS